MCSAAPTPGVKSEVTVYKMLLSSSLLLFTDADIDNIFLKTSDDMFYFCCLVWFYCGMEQPTHNTLAKIFNIKFNKIKEA